MKVKELLEKIESKTPYEINQDAMAAEAGSTLKRIRDPAKLAKAIAKLKSFRKMVDGSYSMVKDALIALEEKRVIPRLDDDDFDDLRQEINKIMRVR